MDAVLRLKWERNPDEVQARYWANPISIDTRAAAHRCRGQCPDYFHRLFARPKSVGREKVVVFFLVSPLDGEVGPKGKVSPR